MLRIFTKKSQGYTLIEILVVIAVIGILVGIVLVAMGSARERGKDTKITSDMLQVQSLAEDIYLDDGDYDGVISTHPEIAVLESDIIAQGGSPLTIKTLSPAGKYCAYTALNKILEGRQVYYCIDYLFENRQIGNPSISCNDTCYFACPPCLDSNGDGLMDDGEVFDMYTTPINCFNQPASCNPSLDLNCDGDIDLGDILSWIPYIPFPCP